MKDIPVFTTALGIASLTLSQIPYTKRAYIRIQASNEPDAFIRECGDFCRAVGAEEIFATGLDEGAQYPLYTAILRMQGEITAIGETEACLFPVTEKTLEAWRSIYNQKVIRVPNGAWMTIEKGEELLSEGSGYFVHRDGELIGIGKASGSEISWVASVVPGGGKTVVQALCHALTGTCIGLEVASANEKAVRLYEKLGFVMTKEISRWYKIC